MLVNKRLEVTFSKFFLPTLTSCLCWRIKYCRYRKCTGKTCRSFFPCFLTSSICACFCFLCRISSQCPASDYGCSSSSAIYSGGKTSCIHASINSDFSTAFMSCNSRRSTSSHCYNGSSCDLLCKLCKRIHPHKSGHSRRSSWSCRSSVGLSWWPPR